MQAISQVAVPSGPSPSAAQATVEFRDIAPAAGLTAENVSGDPNGKRYILETTGNGVGIFDFDNDGRMDVLLINATTMDGKGAGERSTSHLYRNLGGLHFEDVTQKAGLGKLGGVRGFVSETMTMMATRTYLLPTTATASSTTTKETGPSKMSRRRLG